RDLQFRGPGDLFGTRQHGICSFRVVDIARDQEILRETRRDAADLLDKDPGLCEEDYRALRSQVLKKYGTALNLGDVG
ncbi:MAG: ATP-dependent DNA helicase RecG, partial [Thermoguttaceae bacterium]|nr:ATP-dependent DNA helicase RecG [Thermoguttaceae bacterium]